MPSRRTRSAFLLGVLAVLALPPAASALVPEALRATTADEENPAAGTVARGESLAVRALMWSQNTAANRRHYDVYVKIGGARKFRINPPGTEGWPGGFDGETVVYEVVRNRRREADIAFYTLAEPRRALPTPAGINTSAWEAHPTISGEWVMFTRGLGGYGRVIVRNVATGRQLSLAAKPGGYVTSGQVNGNWAVAARCGPAACNVWRLNIAAALAGAGSSAWRLLRNPGGYQYAPSVASDGTVYLAHTAKGCGRSVKIVRIGGGKPRAVLASLRAGSDLRYTYAHELPAGGVEVLFDQTKPGSCASAREPAQDIYRIVDPS